MAIRHEWEALARLCLELDALECVNRRYCNDMTRCLRCQPNDWVPPATPAIVRAFGAELTGKEVRMLAACASEGERLVTLSAVAAAAGVAVDDILRLVSKLGFRNWAALRATVRLSHAVHRLQRGDDVSSDVVGELAGVANGWHGLDSLARYHTGASFADLLKLSASEILSARGDWPQS